VGTGALSSGRLKRQGREADHSHLDQRSWKCVCASVLLALCLHTEAPGHRHTGTQGHRQTGTQGHRHICAQAHRDTCTQGHRHTGTQGHRDRNFTAASPHLDFPSQHYAHWNADTAVVPVTGRSSTVLFAARSYRGGDLELTIHVCQASCLRWYYTVTVWPVWWEDWSVISRVVGRCSRVLSSIYIIYIYIVGTLLHSETMRMKYIQDLCQSRLCTAGDAMSSVAQATTAVCVLQRSQEWPPLSLKSLMFYVSGFSLSSAVNICCFMNSLDFSVLPAWFCYIMIRVRKFQNSIPLYCHNQDWVTWNLATWIRIGTGLIGSRL
jgi:hypothetical protein